MVNYTILSLFVLLALLLSAKKSQKNADHSKRLRYGKISTTLKGHNVRSKGERTIADWLYSNKIKYLYEPKLSRFIPDFFLPEHGMVIEYYGLRDAPGKIGHDYRKKILTKRGYFSSLSIQLIELYQEDLSRLDIILPEMFLKHS
ncbi:MAG: hypothetical protein HeimC2_38200 [Candidatus Heimdallarchaeota archaeon LC_2]|nr:MAG: hypothetical protein HeimC2_38200 [Candidatus Heimdallarchaeota archaeon LC_2]